MADVGFANKMKSKAETLLERFGEPTGNLVLVRTVMGPIDPLKPSAGPTVTTEEYTFTGVLYEEKSDNEELLQRGALKLVIAPDSIPVLPKTSDKITFLDRSYEIEMVNRVRAAGVDVLFDLTLKD